ncbi:HAD hydrolase family protein [Clostridium sp. JS66]|nr:HAD hydrolase family protein [Clostridium sp. JS66]WPC43397.1 HAD hydrolase family protein [Clostridium sp. JS66]
MFRQVGMPIAMGNAVDKVKLEAKYVTKSNDEFGIAYAIDNFIMKEELLATKTVPVFVRGRTLYKD